MKYFPTILSLTSLLATSLIATPLQESGGAVSSTYASYDGNALILTGHVVLDHGLGKMNAEQASLEKQENAGKDFPFSVIHLKKDVLLSLKTNAQIQCGKADFDFTNLKGFLSAQENEKVIYTDTLKKKARDHAFFQLMGETIELSLSKKEQANDKVDYEIETILAKDDVIIDYAKEFTVRADHALYRKSSELQGKNFSKEFQGIVSAYPKNSEHPCQIAHDGDLIDADSIDLDMLHSKLSMHHPRGSLLSRILPGVQKAEIRFRSDYLLWDHQKNILTLKGHVNIQEDAIGDLQAEEELQISQQIQEGKRLLKSIRSKGKTSLKYLDLEEKKPHHLVCFGHLRIDREKLNGFLDSPLVQGVVPEHLQIHYEESEITAFSNQASIEYALIEESLRPVSLTLKGNIRLLSRETEKSARCGLADRLSYSPSTRTLILSADPGKKVLFWDENQSIRISAQEVHITRDQATHQDAIKGVGNVKFAFSSDETLSLKKFFPFFKEVYEPK